MEPVWIAGIVLLVCMLLKVPVFVSMIVGSAAYFMLMPNIASHIAVQRFTSGLESVPLLAAPFFICAGTFMNYCGVTPRIMKIATILTGRMPGGLAQANVTLSLLMSGLCASNLADAAMEARIMVPEMEKQGLPKAFSTVVTAFSAVIVPLIPPGVAMILYGALASVSIGKLFISGISIGLFVYVWLLLLTLLISIKRGYKPYRTEKATAKELFHAVSKSALALFLPIIIIGGIRIGVFTPTEAGAVAVLYTIILGLYYKELDRTKFIAALKDSAITIGAVMLIVGSSAVFAWIITREQVPQRTAAWLLETTDNKYAFLIGVNIFLLIIGMFFEGTSLLIILVPLLAPIANAYGIDPIQFAFIFIFNLSIGAITPPLGTLMFVTCSVTGCKTKDFYKESIPYFGVFLIILACITFIPGITTAILKLFY